MKNIAGLRLQVDVEGTNELTHLGRAAQGAEVAEHGLRASSAAMTQALARQSAESARSAAALRQYAEAARALARGDIGAAATKIGELSARSGVLRALMSPLGVAIGGVATAVGAFAYITAQAEKESFALSKALVLSGNAAGVTRDQLREMAEEIDGVVGTEAEAISTLGQLASSGKVAGENLQEFATVAQQLKRTVGTPVEDTVRAFAELGRSPVEASLKLNESMNYLTVEIYEQIRALEEQGRLTEAGELAQRAYASASAERARQLEQDLGIVQRAARATAGAFAGMWDAVLSIGRQGTIDEQIENLEAQFKTLQVSVATAEAAGGNPIDQRRALLAIHDRIEALRDLKAEEREAAKAGEARSKALSSRLATQREELALGAARKAQAEELRQIQFGSDISGIQQALSTSLAGYSAYTTQLEALRDADLVSARDYFVATRRLVEQDTAARVGALRAENARIAQEIGSLEQARDTAGRGTNTESERIKTEAPFLRQIITLQESMKRNQADITAARRDEANQLSAISAKQVAAISSVVAQLQQETDEYNLLATAGAHAADAIERLRVVQAAERSGLPDAKDRATAALGARDSARNTAVIAESERELRLLRMGNEERRIEEATRRLSANATTEQVLALADNIREMERADQFNAQLESMRQAFDEFSEDYVLSYKEMYDEIDARIAEHTMTEREAAEARGLIARAEGRSRMTAAQKVFGGLSDLMATENRKLFKIGKAAAIANATLSAGEAIMNAYKTSPWYLGLALGVSAAATLYAQIEQLKSVEPRGFMRGGWTGNRPRDEIAGVVHGQEFVMNAAATSRIGAGNLDALQSGAATVLPNRGFAANSSPFGAPSVTIIDQSTGKKDWDIEMMEGRMQIIARDAADRAVATQTPKLVSGEISDPNSSISKAISRNVLAQRRRA